MKRHRLPPHGDPDLDPIERFERIDELDSKDWLSESALETAVSHLVADIKNANIGSERKEKEAIYMLEQRDWISEDTAEEFDLEEISNLQHVKSESGNETQVYDPQSDSD